MARAVTRPTPNGAWTRRMSASWPASPPRPVAPSSSGILTALLLVTLVAAMLGMLPKWVPILAALPVIGFVVAAAMTSSQRSSAKQARPARPARTARRADAPADAAPAPAAAAPVGRGMGELERVG